MTDHACHTLLGPARAVASAGRTSRSLPGCRLRGQPLCACQLQIEDVMNRACLPSNCMTNALDSCGWEVELAPADILERIIGRQMVTKIYQSAKEVVAVPKKFAVEALATPVARKKTWLRPFLGLWTQSRRFATRGDRS